MNSSADEALVEAVSPTTPHSRFEAEQLQFPPVPPHLVALLLRGDSAAFATKPLQQTPYDLGHYLDDFEADPGLSAYAVVGFDGHGTNSWAAH